MSIKKRALALGLALTILSSSVLASDYVPEEDWNVDVNSTYEGYDENSDGNVNINIPEGSEGGSEMSDIQDKQSKIRSANEEIQNQRRVIENKNLNLEEAYKKLDGFQVEMDKLRKEIDKLKKISKLWKNQLVKMKRKRWFIK